MKYFLIMIAVTGCGTLIGTKPVSSSVSVIYSVNLSTGDVTYTASSRACGVLVTGVAHADRSIAACVAATNGTSLVGQLQGAPK